MLNYWQAIVLGIIEGVTEFLPISSTGHLILVGKFLNIPVTEFYKSFEIFIQLGAIGAVIILYWRQLFNKQIIYKLIAAFLPTAILGLIFYSLIKKFLLGNSLVVVIALGVGGLGLLWFEKYYQERNIVSSLAQITWYQAMIIGLFQSLAFVPGVSRAAATIIGGLILGLNRKTIVEFSFLLAVPTMLAASALDLYKSGFNFTNQQLYLLMIGVAVALAVALVVIKWFLAFIQNHKFTSFAWYRILVAIVFCLALLY